MDLFPYANKWKTTTPNQINKIKLIHLIKSNTKSVLSSQVSSLFLIPHKAKKKTFIYFVHIVEREETKIQTWEKFNVENIYYNKTNVKQINMQNEWMEWNEIKLIDSNCKNKRKQTHWIKVTIYIYIYITLLYKTKTKINMAARCFS